MIQGRSIGVLAALALGLVVPSGASAAKPNLKVTALGEPPAEVIETSGFEVTDTTSNRSGRRALPSITRYYLSTDTVKDDEDPPMEGGHQVPRLKPKKSHESTTDAYLPIWMEASSAKYHLIACADDDEVVTEKNENDNCRASEGRLRIVAPAGAVR